MSYQLTVMQLYIQHSTNQQETRNSEILIEVRALYTI